MDISLSKLPWYAQVGAFVALAVSGAVAFHNYYEVPARVDMALRENQLQLIRGANTRGLATAKKLDEFSSQVDELEALLRNLRAQLPEEKDAAELLRSLQKVALQSNLTIKGFKPSATVTQEMHVEWPIALELDGTYHNLAIFFDRVGRFPRIVNISSLSVVTKDKPSPNSTISAKCVATTFVLLDPATGAHAKPKKTPAPKKAA